MSLRNVKRLTFLRLFFVKKEIIISYGNTRMAFLQGDRLNQKARRFISDGESLR